VRSFGRVPSEVNDRISELEFEIDRIKTEFRDEKVELLEEIEKLKQDLRLKQDKIDLMLTDTAKGGENESY
jgi:tellurite resistance protein